MQSNPTLSKAAAISTWPFIPCSLSIAKRGLVLLIEKFEGISKEREGFIPVLSESIS